MTTIITAASLTVGTFADESSWHKVIPIEQKQGYKTNYLNEDVALTAKVAELIPHPAAGQK